MKLGKLIKHICKKYTTENYPIQIKCPSHLHPITISELGEFTYTNPNFPNNPLPIPLYLSDFDRDDWYIYSFNTSSDDLEGVYLVTSRS